MPDEEIVVIELQARQVLVEGRDADALDAQAADVRRDSERVRSVIENDQAVTVVIRDGAGGVRDIDCGNGRIEAWRRVAQFK